MPDRVSLVHDPATGVEAIRACFTAHAYDLHRHDDWLVGVTDRGVQDFMCRGARRRSTPGRVILIEPQEAHDGQAGAAGGFAYRMLYLPRPWLRAGLADAPDGDPAFSASLCDDPRLACAVRTACTTLFQPSERLARDAALDAVLDRLRPHLGRRCRGMPEGRAEHAARLARERLHDDMAADIGADELAHAAGVADRFQLARAFRAAYGTPPHAYLLQIRLLHARRLLATGMRPAAVAAECGFADQSHLGRRSRRAYGVTPACYGTLCTDVPDRGIRTG